MKTKLEASAWPSFCTLAFLDIASWSEERILWVLIYLWTSLLSYLVPGTTVVFVEDSLARE